MRSLRLPELVVLDDGAEDAGEDGAHQGRDEHTGHQHHRARLQQSWSKSDMVTYFKFYLKSVARQIERYMYVDI